jgi:RNA polymerase sigma factor (sigma-70 family)
MARGTLAAVLRRLRLLTAETDDRQSDGRLLERFARGRDEAAFEALLGRHGPMVLGVCLRLLHDAAAAEDAFQATFLVLVRKAPALDGSRSLAGWLHTVARHVALKARTRDARRRDREEERLMPAQTDPLDEAAWRELRPVLDEEVGRLTDRYRLPVVLCYLEGKSHEAAAAELGWPKGTVAGRLARARDLLRARLTRRGVTLPAAFAMLVAARSSSAAVPAGLLSATLKSAADRAAPEGVSAGVAALVEEGSGAVGAGKLKAPLLVLALAGLLAAGAGLVAQQILTGSPEAAGRPRAAAEKPGGADRPRDEGKGELTDRYNDPLPPAAVARMGTLRFRTQMPMLGLAFTGNRTLAVGAWGEVVHLLALPEGKAEGRLDLPLPMAGHALAASPDGKLLAVSTSGNGPLYLYEMPGGKQRHRLAGFNGEANAVAFSPDGKRLASGGQQLVLWDTATGKQLWRSETAESSSSPLAYSPDGKSLASGGRGGEVRLWDAATGKALASLMGNGQRVSAVAYSPDGKFLAAGDEDGTLRVWDVAARKELRHVKAHRAYVLSVAYAPDGKLLASAGFDGTGPLPVSFEPDAQPPAPAGAAGTVCLWDAGTLKERRRFPRHVRGALAVAFSRDGKLLASAGEDQAVGLWEVATGKDLTPAGGHRESVTAVALLQGDKILATASNDRTVRLWEAATGKELHRLEGHEMGVTALAAAPGGKLLASGDTLGTVCVWDAATGKRLHDFEAHKHEIQVLAFSADGKSLASWSRGRTIHVWDVDKAKGRLLDVQLQLDVMPLDHMCAAVSPDGKRVFVGCDDGRVRVCETASGKQVRSIEAHAKPVSAVAVSHDGKTLATGSWGDDTVRLWEVATGKEVRRLALPGGAGALAFSADGKALAAGNVAGPIRLWDLASGKEVARLPGHQGRVAPRSVSARGRVTGLAFSADGTRLVSGSDDTTALVWNLGKVRKQK